MVETLSPTSHFGGLSSRLNSPYNPATGYEYPFSTADQSAASFDPGLAAAWLISVATTVAQYWQAYTDQKTPQTPQSTGTGGCSKQTEAVADALLAAPPVRFGTTSFGRDTRDNRHSFGSDYEATFADRCLDLSSLDHSDSLVDDAEKRFPDIRPTPSSYGEPTGDPSYRAAPLSPRSVQ